MKLHALADSLGLVFLTPPPAPGEGADLTRGHVSDMLSDVLGNAPAGGVLVTIQVHMNVVAVAVHAGLGAVVFAAGRTPAAEVIARAVEEHLPLLASSEPAFDVVGRLHALGLRGREA